MIFLISFVRESSLEKLVSGKDDYLLLMERIMVSEK